MTGRLDGRRVLVTGGATGIGAGISRRLLDEGARVVVAQRTADELAAALDASGLRDNVVGIVADLASPAAAETMVVEAISLLGGLDGLVNNASITGPPAQRSVVDMDGDYIERMIATNLGAVVGATVAASRHMAEHGGGVVVSVASVLAHSPAPSAALYSALKAGLLGFTRGVALELGSSGVRAVTVSPGDIATPSSVPPPAAPGQRAVRSPALARRGEPDEIGAVVAFLLSDDASYVTGADVVVDGGFLLG